MISNNAPAKVPALFASGGLRSNIPLLASGATAINSASYDVGFPLVTMQTIASGGKPPNGSDFNAIFYALTGVANWYSSGGSFKYDSTHSTTIGGYPQGATLVGTDNRTFWLSTSEGNTTDPDGTGALNWIPLNSYGMSNLSLTGGVTTLVSSQWSKPILTITGNLTSNVSIIFPAIIKQWTVVNLTTGAFTLTCKTSSGTGIVIPQNYALNIYGDGTNIQRIGAVAAQSWQDKTSVRTIGGVYTNNTGNPITAHVGYVLGTTGSLPVMTIGGALALPGTSGSVGILCSMSVVVPANASYSLTATSGSISLSSWFELTN